MVAFGSIPVAGWSFPDGALVVAAPRPALSVVAHTACAQAPLNCRRPFSQVAWSRGRQPARPARRASGISGKRWRAGSVAHETARPARRASGISGKRWRAGSVARKTARLADEGENAGMHPKLNAGTLE